MNESHGETLRHFVDFRGRMNGRSFRGDFMKYHGPLDLTEVQGGYIVSVEEVESQEG